MIDLLTYLRESILSSTKSGIMPLLQKWFKDNTSINKKDLGEDKELVQLKDGIGIDKKDFRGFSKKDRYVSIYTFDKDNRSKVTDIPLGVSKEFLETFEKGNIKVHEKCMNDSELKKVIDKLPENFNRIYLVGDDIWGKGFGNVIFIGVTGKDKNLHTVEDIIDFIKTFKEYKISGHFTVDDVPGWDESIAETHKIIKQAVNKYSKFSYDEHSIVVGGKSYTEAEKKKALGLS